MRDHFPHGIVDRTEIVTCAPHELLRVLERDPAVDVVCPGTAQVGAAELSAGTFGLVLQFGAGLDTVDVPAATDHGVWVANMPGVNAPEVAEHAIMLLLSISRRMYESNAGFEPDAWGLTEGRALAGSTVCIVGFGAIGRQIASRLRPFGARLVVAQRDASKGLPAEYDFVEVVDRLEEGLASADSVVLAASLEAGAGPILDRRAFAAFRPGTLLVNVGRGRLIDEHALLERLDDGTIAAAGLDVFATEPHPLRALRVHPHVISTAHVAGITDKFFTDGSRAFGADLERYAQGRPPENPTNSVAAPRARFTMEGC